MKRRSLLINGECQLDGRNRFKFAFDALAVFSGLLAIALCLRGFRIGIAEELRNISNSLIRIGEHVKLIEPIKSLSEK